MITLGVINGTKKTFPFSAPPNNKTPLTSIVVGEQSKASAGLMLSQLLVLLIK
jgi:hypothetical protein